MTNDLLRDMATVHRGGPEVIIKSVDPEVIINSHLYFYTSVAYMTMCAGVCICVCPTSSNVLFW